MFLVDFDELKQGSGADAGVTPEPAEPEPNPSPEGGSGGTEPGGGGGGSGSGPSPSGGEGGSSPARPCSGDAECDDSNPCTTDACRDGACDNTPMVCEPSGECMEAACVDGECVEQALTGVFADDYENVFTGDTLYRTTLIAGEDRFFHALYGVFSGTEDLRVSGFGRDGTDTLDVQTLASGLNGQEFEIASSGGLVVDGEGNLNVYVAARDLREGADPSVGEVLRIQFDPNLDLSSRIATKQGTQASYRFTTPRVGPEASFLPGVGPFVVWPARTASATPEDGLMFQAGDTVTPISDPGTAFIPVAAPIVAMRALYSDTTPAAVWMTALDGGGVGLFAGTAGGQTNELSQCHDDATYEGYNLHAGLTLDELWTVSWSKQATQPTSEGAPTFLSENIVVRCAGAACEDRSGQAVGAECSTETYDERVNQGFQHLSVEAFRDPDNPDELNQIIVLAAVDSDRTTLALVANAIDVAPSGNGATTRIDNVNFAVGSGATAPNWPEVAVLPPNKVAVSWIQRSADGTRDEAHFARYRICK